MVQLTPPLGSLPSTKLAHHQTTLSICQDTARLDLGKQLGRAVYPPARGLPHVRAYDVGRRPEQGPVGFLEGQRIRVSKDTTDEVAAAAEEGALGVGQLVVLSHGLGVE